MSTARKLKLLEMSFWPVFFIAIDVINATSVMMEFDRRGSYIEHWKPLVAEFTSGFMFVLLIPFVVWFDGRRPFQKDTWKTTALIHLGLTVPFSLAHVGGMVALRKVFYGLQNMTYDFGSVPVELFYEYRKDIGTYAMILGVLYGYRHFRYRYFEANLDPPKAPGKALERVLIKTRGKETFLNLNKIERLEAAGNYVNIHAGDARYFLRSTLATLEEKLPQNKFIRVHRSNIVNIEAIKEIIPNPSGDGRINLNNGDHVPLSRRFRERLKALEI